MILEDVNDEPPVFTKKTYDVTIKENQPATKEEKRVVLRVEAVDKVGFSGGTVFEFLKDFIF